jgi:alkaline phosphatase D
MRGNRPPSDGLQFFGTVHLDGRTEVLTVSLYKTTGERIYRVELEPERRR